MSQPFELERGSSKLTGNMDNGVPDGPFKVFDAKKPLAAMQYQQGQLQGVCKNYFNNGKLARLEHWRAETWRTAAFSPQWASGRTPAF